MQISITIKGDVGNLSRIVQGVVQKVFNQVVIRGPRAANALRNAELRVLSGKRGGATYRKAGTKGASYTASAPGEPPAVRSGTLRRQWRPGVEGGSGGGGVSIRPTIYSDTPYAAYLEFGTRKMAARPFKDKIIEEAKPEIIKIYSEPYL